MLLPELRRKASLFRSTVETQISILTIMDMQMDRGMKKTDSPIPAAYAEPAAPTADVQANPTRPLRWWPAAVVLAAMLLVRFVPRFWESPSLPVMMAGFMGPAAIGLLILIWWLAASGAAWKEKLIGLIGLIAIAAIFIKLSDASMHGMGIIVQVIPTGIAAFAVGLIACSRNANWRLPIALALAALVFGGWDLVRSEGLTGRFESELAWRWSPTPEDNYLSELKNRSAELRQEPSNVAAEITLASSAWPGFRGPVRDGVLPGVTLAEDWKAVPPKKVWSTKIGPGWSSFSVAGDRLFTQEQRGDNEAVVCLDANTGRTIWDYVYPSRFWEAIAGAGPRATPTIADEGLFALGAAGVMLCLDPVTGAERWKHDLKVDADRQPPQWGFSASPLVTAGLVIVHAGGQADKGVLAYEATSGDLKWSVASGDHSYSSVQLTTIDSVPGLLMLTNAGLQFLQVNDGQTIWNSSWPVDNYRAIQPLVIDNSVLVATSLGLGTRKITATRDGDSKWNVVEDWTSLQMKPDFNDFVYYQGYIYGFDADVFACIDAETGTRQWKRGRYGNGQVLLLPESGQLLVATEKGEIVLLHASPDKLDEVAKFNAIEGKTWNHPVLVNGQLYVRNAAEAARYDLSLQ